MIYLNEHTDRIDIAAALAKVSAQRREQALRYRYESGQRLSLAVYLLLMEGLEKEYGILEPPLFDYTPEGKLFLSRHHGIHFSFSHSGTLAVCAISDRPVGIDIESVRKIYVFELSALGRCDARYIEIIHIPRSIRRPEKIDQAVCHDAVSHVGGMIHIIEETVFADHSAFLSVQIELVVNRILDADHGKVVRLTDAFQSVLKVVAVHENGEQ